MKIFEGELTKAQIDAGIAAMKGRFDSTKVMKALAEAGVTNSLSGMEHLIARELRNGRIRRIARGIFQEN